PPRLGCLSYFTILCPHHAPPHISTISLPDALPISYQNNTKIQMDKRLMLVNIVLSVCYMGVTLVPNPIHSSRRYLQLKKQIISKDRKSTRLNSSHVSISYAVFCLRKKITRTTVFCR